MCIRDRVQDEESQTIDLDEEGEAPKKKGNLCSRAFFYLWPSEAKPFHTEEGERMRSAWFATTFIHCVLIIFCLGLVGFWPMFYNIILSAWSYSCQLTLRQK